MRLLAAFCMIAMSLVAADVSGKWSGTLDSGNGSPGAAFMILKQTGAELTGSAGPDADRQWTIAKGKITGTKLTGEVQNPDGPLYKFALALEGDHLKGDVEVFSGGQTQKGKLDMERVK